MILGLMLAWSAANAADIGNDERFGVGGFVVGGVGTSYGAQFESGVGLKLYTREDAAFAAEFGGWVPAGGNGVATRVRLRFDRLTYQFNRGQSSRGLFYSGSGLTSLWSGPANDPWFRIGFSQVGGMLWQLRDVPLEIGGEVGFDLYVFDKAIGVTFGSDLALTGGLQVRYFF